MGSGEKEEVWNQLLIHHFLSTFGMRCHEQDHLTSSEREHRWNLREQYDHNLQWKKDATE